MSDCHLLNPFAPDDLNERHLARLRARWPLPFIRRRAGARMCGARQVLGCLARLGASSGATSDASGGRIAT